MEQINNPADILDLPDEKLLEVEDILPEAPQEEEPKEEVEVPQEEPNQENEQEAQEEPQEPSGDYFTGSPEEGGKASEESPADDQGTDDSKEEESSDKLENNDVDYRAFYEKLTAPFKANGKMITPEGPEDIIQLMQMGANYVKKMQQMSEHRRTLQLLQKNNLLDNPDDLDLLIGIYNKDPQAINKFFRDNKLEPLDVDTINEPTYRPGSYQLTDAESQYYTAFQDISSMEHGEELLYQVSNWDAQSCREVWQDPRYLYLLRDQMENGTYNQVMTELNRQQALGYIPPNQPMLHNYITVFNALANKGLINDGADKQVKPIARQTAPVNGNANNKAKAAGTTRSSGRPKPVIDYLNMDDETFIKQYKELF